ncbi:MAG: glycosyltransferase family 2 protein [Pirellulaceae bacterium]
MKEPLTVLIPCRNERLNIGPCIEGVLAIADEILIADSLSTDNTVDIARSYNKVRVIEREYNTSGDFKNWAIPQATHGWVLIVDADERVTPKLAEEIQLELSRGPQHDGYWIFRENHFLGHRMHYGDARTDSVLRLFRRDTGRYVGPSDHGEVQISTGRVGTLKNRFVHYSVWSYDQLLKKYERYTTLQAEQWQEKGRDATYFNLLVRPAFRFFREYILQRGILDGKVGLQQAWLAAFYSFQKQARLWELNHGQKQPVPRNADYIDYDSERRAA